MCLFFFLGGADDGVIFLMWLGTMVSGSVCYCNLWNERTPKSSKISNIAGAGMGCYEDTSVSFPTETHTALQDGCLQET